MMTVYAINAETFGLSKWDGTLVNSVVAACSHDRTPYLVTTDGLYESAGDDDDGTDIEVLTQTGVLDFGLPEKEKYCHRVTLYGKASNGAKITVVEHQDGVQSEYPYTTEDLGGDEQQAGWVKPGKGIHGEALGFKFENISGGSLEIRKANAVVLAGRRAR